MNGMECRLNIYSMYADSDDDIGGAILTGTTTGEWVRSRIEDVPSDMLPLVQGIITDQGYYATVWPLTTIVENNYVVEVVYPPSHLLFGKRLRVKQVTRTSSNKSRAHIELLLDRINEGH